MVSSATSPIEPIDARPPFPEESLLDEGLPDHVMGRLLGCGGVDGGLRDPRGRHLKNQMVKNSPERAGNVWKSPDSLLASLAKVGIEGSNPFTRSSFLKRTGRPTKSHCEAAFVVSGLPQAATAALTIC